MPLSALRRDLKAQIRPCYLVLSEENMLLRHSAELVRRATLRGDETGLNDSSQRAGDEGAAGALRDAWTLPMLGPRRWVWLRDLQDANVQLLEDLSGYLERPSETSVLFLSGSSWPKGQTKRTRALEQLISKQGWIWKPGPRDLQPQQLAVKIARSKGCDLSPAAARLLLKRVGKSLDYLDMELEKLATYCGGQGSIEVSDVEAVSSLLAESPIWDLTEALVQRSAGPALLALHRLLEAQQAPHAVLGMISWQLRQLLRLQDADQRGVSPKQAGIRMPPRKVDACRRALRRNPLSEVEIYSLLARANSDMNALRAGDRRVLEGLVLQLLRG